MDSSNDTGRRKLDEKRAAALRPDSMPRRGGSAAHRNQQNVSRSLGSDPLVKHEVKDRIHRDTGQPETDCTCTVSPYF